MKTLMIVGVLLVMFQLPCWAEGEVGITEGIRVVETVAKPVLTDRIETRIEALERAIPYPDREVTASAIMDEEIVKEVQDFASLLKPAPLPIIRIAGYLLKFDLSEPEMVKLISTVAPVDLPKLTVAIYDVGYQGRKVNEVFLSVGESERLKKVLRTLPSKQYPVLKVPFFETTNDDPSIYRVDVTKWVDVHKIQEDLKVGGYNLVVLSSDTINNASLLEMGASVKSFPLGGKEFEVVYQAVKEVAPDVPVGFIAVLFPELETWLASFKVQPDVWLLFNCPTFGANWQKVKTRWFAKRPVVANLNHHFQYHDYGGQEYGSVQYRACIEQLKALGFSGAIFWRTK